MLWHGHTFRVAEPLWGESTCCWNRYMSVMFDCLFSRLSGLTSKEPSKSATRWIPLEEFSNVESVSMPSLIAKFMGPTWGPSGADRTQVGPMLASRVLLSEMTSSRTSPSTPNKWGSCLTTGNTVMQLKCILSDARCFLSRKWLCGHRFLRRYHVGLFKIPMWAEA